MTRVIFEHGGTLEKYIGDAVMATFGTPSSGPDDASRALRCAVTLASETSRWSAERVARGELPVEIGIGAHYGEAVVGSIGDGQRLDYLVIGDTVPHETNRSCRGGSIYTVGHHHCRGVRDRRRCGSRAPRRD